MFFCKQSKKIIIIKNKEYKSKAWNNCDMFKSNKHIFLFKKKIQTKI